MLFEQSFLLKQQAQDDVSVRHLSAPWIAHVLLMQFLFKSSNSKVSEGFTSRQAVETTSLHQLAKVTSSDFTSECCEAPQRAACRTASGILGSAYRLQISAVFLEDRNSACC